MTCCPVCHCSATRPHLDIPIINFSRRISSGTIRRCESCHIFFLAPFPDENDIKELYVVGNIFSKPRVNPYASLPFFAAFERLYREYGDDTRFIVTSARKFAAKRPGKPLRILDVGCSTGGLMARFRQLIPDCEVQGTDLDPGSKSSAPPALRDAIWIGNLLDFPEGQFDIITMRFVIEHLMDPKPYLEKIRNLLAPGGCLMVSTPDILAPRAVQAGAQWDLITRPTEKIGHCLWFDPHSLGKLLRESGFDIVRMSNRGPAIDHAPPLLRKLLAAVLGQDKFSNRFIANFHLRILWSVAVDGWLAERLGWGDNIYAFLRKS